MYLPISNRVMLQGLLAGALVTLGASGCSRSNRTESGSDTTAAMAPDTAATMPDTAAATPSAGSPTATTKTSATDTAGAGYRAMERDTTEATDTAAAAVSAAADAEVKPMAPDSGVSASEMARDTAVTVAEQTDTAVPAEGEDRAAVAAGAVGAAGAAAAAGDNDGRIRPPEDSAGILGRVNTDTANAVAMADTAESERITPPEDSTKLAGSQTTDTAGVAVASSDTIATGQAPDTAAAEAEGRAAVAAGVVGAGAGVAAREDNGRQGDNDGGMRPREDSTENFGRVSESGNAATQADSTGLDRTDEVGAAAIGGGVTGADAIALMTRVGTRCIVLDPESEPSVTLDMSNTPATLNPCGLGSMVLTRIWTKKE